MRKLLFRKPVWGAVGLALVAALVFGVMALNDGDDQAQAQVPLLHGITILKRCDSPSKVGDTTSCFIRATHADDYGDTITLHEAWDEVASGAGTVRVPAAGNLPIDSVSGNTTCTVGGSLPCEIGPDTGAGPGQVTFRSDQYVVHAGDPDPLTDQGTVRWQDMCDAPDTSGCNDTPNNIIQAPAATDLVQPCIDVSKEAVPETSKAGDSVDYTVEVCNCGDDVTLENITVDDSLLGDLSDSYADTLAPDACESHVFPYTVLATDPDPLVNTVTVEANPEGLTNVVSDEASAEVDLVHPDFEISKECSPDPVYVGDTITWTVTLTNTGDVTLHIEVEDPTAGISETIVLAAGASETITRSRLVTDADVPAITNTVTATATLDPALGLDNVIERSATDSCGMTTPTPSPTPSPTPTPLPAVETPAPTPTPTALPVALPPTGGGPFGPGAGTTLWTMLFLGGAAALLSAGFLVLRGRKQRVE
jgi:hypothetical protein